MRYNVIVSVPFKKQLPYTLYAEGFKTDIHLSEDSDYAHFKFQGGTVFALFYTFRNFRRAYLATCWENEQDGEAVRLPGVNQKLCILFSGRGKKVDHLKRALYLLTEKAEEKIYAFPLLFWYKVAGLISYSGAKKTDLMILYSQFNKKRKRK